MMNDTKISIVIPALNEEKSIANNLRGLQYLRKLGHEIILSDGGSVDDTLALARPLVDHWIKGSKGRAKQLNAGAKIATGQVLLFLHADTLLPENTESILNNALIQGFHWGRFDVQLSGQQFMFRLIEKMINLRSRISGVATGDQAIFIRKNLFELQEGFPELALMEDIAMSKRLKKMSKPYCSKACVITSSRRWEEHGIWRTIFLMWRLRFAYFIGISPSCLADRYRHH